MYLFDLSISEATILLISYITQRKRLLHTYAPNLKKKNFSKMVKVSAIKEHFPIIFTSFEQ